MKKSPHRCLSAAAKQLRWIAGLVANAIAAAITKSGADYIALVRQATAAPCNVKGMGLPAGP